MFKGAKVAEDTGENRIRTVPGPEEGRLFRAKVGGKGEDYTHGRLQVFR